MKGFPKFRNALFLSYIWVSLIPILVLAIVSLYLLAGYVENNALEKNNLVAELTANEVSTFIQGNLNSLNILKEALNNSGSSDQKEIQKLLQAILGNHGSFENIFILNRQGTVTNLIPYNPLFIGFDFSTNDFFTQTAAGNRTYFSQSFIFPLTNLPSIIIAIPYDGGVIAGIITLSGLNEILNKIRPGESSNAAIADAKGAFIAHTDLQKVRQREIEENLGLFRQGSRTNSGFRWLEYDNKNVLTSVSFVKNLNWAIIIYQDEKEALAPVKNIRSLTYLGMAISLILVLFFSIRRTYNITRPVSKLIAETKRVSSGDYSSKVECELYDEFNKLIDEFNLMIENIQQREKHFSSLFYNNGTKMLLMDNSSMKIIDANPAAAEFFSMNAEEMKNIDINRAEYSLIFNISSDKNDVQNYIVQTRVNNSDKYLDIYAAPIELREGSFSYLIIHDITDRILAEKEVEEYKSRLERLVEERTNQLSVANEKLALELENVRRIEENLRDQLSFFAKVIDTVPVPIFIRDMNRVYVDCNKFFEHYIGKTRDEIIGRSLFELIPEPFASKYAAMDDSLINLRNIQSYEYKFPDADGRLKDVIFNKAALIKADGTPVGIIGSFQDITEHKLMEEEIKKALDKEKELNELKSRFISTTSHEFRTPLTAILSSADLLEMYGRKWPEEKYYKHTGQIRRSVKYMTELLDDILTISRAESGIDAFSPGYINLHEVCSEVMESVRVKANEKHILRFDSQLGKNYFNLDEKLIRQILSNLLSNAIKYSPDGGMVRLSVSSHAGRLHIDVSDEGIGIAEEEKKNLMLPFYRARNAGTIPGTGLGLSIVKKSVELHGGEIFFDSRLNAGTTFSIIIPLTGDGNEENSGG